MIQSGTVTFGWSDDPDWADLLKPAAEISGAEPEVRSFLSPDVAFRPPFASPPVVVLALSGVDADAQFNLRLRLSVEDVETEEFNIRIHTWGDSLIYGALVTWVAYDAQ